MRKKIQRLQPKIQKKKKLKNPKMKSLMKEKSLKQKKKELKTKKRSKRLLLNKFGSGNSSMKSKPFGLEIKKKLKKRNITTFIKLLQEIMKTHSLTLTFRQRVKLSSSPFSSFLQVLLMISLKTIMEEAQL